MLFTTKSSVVTNARGSSPALSKSPHETLSSSLYVREAVCFGALDGPKKASPLNTGKRARRCSCSMIALAGDDQPLMPAMAAVTKAISITFIIMLPLGEVNDDVVSQART